MAKFQVLQAIRVGRKMIRPNFNRIVDIKRATERFELIDPKVIVELPPKELVTANADEAKDRENRTVLKAAWDTTIKEWESLRYIRRVGIEGGAK